MVFVKLENSIVNKLHLANKQNKFGLVQLSELRQSLQQFNKNNPTQTLYLHKLIQPEQIYLDQDIVILEQQAYVDPPQIKLEKELRARRVEELKYQKMVKGIANPARADLHQDNVKTYEKSVNFGISFIFSFFLSGLAGYYFAKYILEWDHMSCLILGVITLIGSLIMETSLFIIKILKEDKIKQSVKQQEELKRKKQFQESIQKDTFKGVNLLQRKENQNEESMSNKQVSDSVVQRKSNKQEKQNKVEPTKEKKQKKDNKKQKVQ